MLNLTLAQWHMPENLRVWKQHTKRIRWSVNIKGKMLLFGVQQKEDSRLRVRSTCGKSTVWLACIVAIEY